jgi:hypothetical protein
MDFPYGCIDAFTFKIHELIQFSKSPIELKQEHYQDKLGSVALRAEQGNTMQQIQPTGSSR